MWDASDQNQGTWSVTSFNMFRILFVPNWVNLSSNQSMLQKDSYLYKFQLNSYLIGNWNKIKTECVRENW